MSVPMTMSDLARRDARVKFFFRWISLITLLLFDLTVNQMRQGNTSGEEAYF